MKRILVTGGNGYIGSHTIVQLVKNGNFEVISVDNLSRSDRSIMDRIHQITGQQVPNHEVDLCNRDELFSLFHSIGPVDGVIHFAAFKCVPESVEEPLMYYRNNVNSLINILEACHHFQVPNFIFSSSCSVYGVVEQLPVTEDTPLGEAACPYAHTKQIGEGMIRAFCHNHPDFNAILLRYFNPIGADMGGLLGELSKDRPNNLMPIILDLATGKRESMTIYGTDYDTRDGSCIRDYIHVTDVADAHVLALQYLVDEKNSSNCELFNLGSGTGSSVLEMIAAFEKITGQKLNCQLGPRRPGDVPAIYSDCSRAHRLLGWQCRYGIEEMISSAWEWAVKTKDL